MEEQYVCTAAGCDFSILKCKEAAAIWWHCVSTQGWLSDSLAVYRLHPSDFFSCRHPLSYVCMLGVTYVESSSFAERKRLLLVSFQIPSYQSDHTCLPFLVIYIYRYSALDTLHNVKPPTCDFFFFLSIYLTSELDWQKTQDIMGT